MIHVHWLREGEVLMIRPEGAVNEEDFAQVASVVDPVIEKRGRLEGLLIDARGFGGWDDTRALLAHLRFIHEHQPKVARIAVVGDQWWLRAAPLAEPFYGTPIRVFTSSEEDAARAWLLESPPEPEPITILPESEGPVIGVRVTGRLRDEDYDRLQQELIRRLPPEGKVRLLAIIDEGFRGWTPKAIFDDIAMAFGPWRHRFEKIAVVAGPGFVRWCVEHFPTGLLPYPVRAFAPEEIDAAWAWVKGEEPEPHRSDAAVAEPGGTATAQGSAPAQSQKPAAGEEEASAGG